MGFKGYDRYTLTQPSQHYPPPMRKPTTEPNHMGIQVTRANSITQPIEIGAVMVGIPSDVLDIARQYPGIDWNCVMQYAIDRADRRESTVRPLLFGRVFWRETGGTAP